MDQVSLLIPPASLFLIFNSSGSAGRGRRAATKLTDVAKIAVSRYFFVMLDKVIAELDERVRALQPGQLTTSGLDKPLYFGQLPPLFEEFCIEEILTLVAWRRMDLIAMGRERLEILQFPLTKLHVLARVQNEFVPAMLVVRFNHKNEYVLKSLALLINLKILFLEGFDGFSDTLMILRAGLVHFTRIGKGPEGVKVSIGVFLVTRDAVSTLVGVKIVDTKLRGLLDKILHQKTGVYHCSDLNRIDIRMCMMYLKI
jgi:hypothetical protein